MGINQRRADFRLSKRRNAVAALKARRQASRALKRPANPFLLELSGTVTRIKGLETGSFNAGLVQMPGSEDFAMVYRPNEYAFIGVVLSKDFRIKSRGVNLQVTNCADPRLVWLPDGRLLMVYSSVTGGDVSRECIRGAIIMDPNQGPGFLPVKQPFRISPPDNARHKNWMPFVHDGEIYLIGTVCPHIVYKLDIAGPTVQCDKIGETGWDSPWMFKEFLRGNTNPVRLDDGNYLGTFHTAVWHEKVCYYDNGVYVFEGKPPFKVLRCANRTYLRAEDAIEPHFRKAGIMWCTFPVGMVRQGERVLISYGDNDSCVKILDTTVTKLLDLTLEIY